MMKKVLLAAAAVAIPVGAAAVPIDNGVIQLGVNDTAQLNDDSVSPSISGETVAGLRYIALPDEYEATSQGCECEGWGAADAGTGLTGYANDANGSAGLSLVSFTVGGVGTDADSGGSTAQSIVDIIGGTQSMRVTHDFTPSLSANLYRVHVTIENTGTDMIADLRYRRTMDWDVDPTPFNEYSTIQGTAGASAVLGAGTNGFCSSNPLNPCSYSGYVSGDVVDAGPTDHGANFDFGFGSLLAGDTFEFDIFYGAALSEREALASLATVGAEVYSFGQSGGNQFGDNGVTFIFGFAGVGGTVVGVPEPGALGLLGFGLLGLGVAARRRKRA